jgi:hypothetical protein
MNQHALLLIFGSVLAGLGFATAAAGQSGPNGPRFGRSVEVRDPGPQRLTVDLELLGGAQPSLADLRLYDADERELPYLLMPPRSSESEWREGHATRPIVGAQHESGFEIDLGSVVTFDRVRFVGLAPPLLKRLRLEASGDRARYNRLLDDASIFDLPAEGLRRVELDTPPGAYRYLRTVWNDRETRAVGTPERLDVRLARVDAAAHPTLAPVRFEARENPRDLSQWRIRLPARHLPIAAIVLESSLPTILRNARIHEARPSAGGLEPTRLGSATLRRTVRSGVEVGDLRVAISAPETAELVLTVENGDNPPFALDRVLIELSPQPWIYFESKRPGTLTARYGSEKLAPPHYDLEAERERIATRSTHLATWRATAVPSPEVPDRSSPPMTALLHGSAIAPGEFAYSRDIESASGGMTTLRLDAAVVAHSQGFSDLRILDPANRQVPYLVEVEGEPLVVPIEVVPLVGDARPKAFDARQSVYRLTLPYAALPSLHVEVLTSARVFRRQVSLAVAAPHRPNKQQAFVTVQQSSWAQLDEGEATPSLKLPLGETRDQTLYLVVEDGDNAALPITACRALLQSRTLRFYHAQGEALKLYYGSATLAPPSYDLEILTHQIEQSTSVEARLGAERARAPTPLALDRQVKWFWGALAATVLVLLLLIVRLVRRA